MLKFKMSMLDRASISASFFAELTQGVRKTRSIKPLEWRKVNCTRGSCAFIYMYKVLNFTHFIIG